MSKAILVMDMPSNCLQCEFSTDDNFTCFCVVNSMECSTVKRPDWCPLRPAPEKRHTLDNFWEMCANIVRNACIDEILGEEIE